MTSLHFNHVNFVARFGENPAEIQKKKKRWQIALPILLVLLGMAAVEGFYLYQIYGQFMPALKEAQSYTQDAQVQTQYAQAQELSQEASLLAGEKSNLLQAKQNVESCPQLTAEVMTAINRCVVSGITLDQVSFSVANGQLQLTGSAADQKLVPDFVTALKATGAMGDSLAYYGEYATLTQKNGVATSLYTFTVTGVLTGGNGQ